MSTATQEKLQATVDRDELLGALLAVNGFAAKTHHIDQYRWFRLTVKDGDGILLASNGDVAASKSITFAACPDCDMLIPRKLIDVARAMPSGATMELTIDGGKMSVHGGKGTTRFKLGLAALEPVDIDAGHDLDWNDAQTMSHQLLDALGTAAQFSAVYDPSRPVLQNVSLKAGNITATDTHRMYHATGIDADIEELTIPASVIKQLAGFGVAELLFTDNAIFGRNGDFHFRARRIDGAFPNLASMIANIYDMSEIKRFEIDVDLLADAVNSVAVISSGPTQPLSMLFKGGEIILDIANQDGDAREVISIEHGLELRVGFNLEQLRSGLGLFTGQIEVSLVNESRPVILSNDDTRFMVAPVRI